MDVKEMACYVFFLTYVCFCAAISDVRMMFLGHGRACFALQ